MNAKQLSAFRAVMLTGSISEASQMLYVSQPAVSRLIKDLEQSLGFELFDRRNSRVYPTPSAHAFFREVERHFIGIDTLAQSAEKIRMMKRGRLRIATAPVFGFSEMPSIISRFLAGRDEVAASFVSDTSVEVANMVGAQQFDLGIVMLPVDSSEISLGACFQTDCQCIAWPGHRFEQQVNVEAEDLHGEPFVAIGEQNTITRFRIDMALRDLQIRPETRIETPFFINAQSFVQERLGVSIVDPFTAYRYQALGGIARPFKPSVPLYFGFITPLNHPPTGLVAEFIDYCIAYLSERVELQPLDPSKASVKTALD